MEKLKTIARIQSAFPAKFGIPRQSGVVEELRADIVFEEEYRDPACLRGLDDFSHIWLIWGFSETKRTVWSPTVRPPRLGGNRRMGVFATRSPFRPNAIGLSSVKLEGITHDPGRGPVLHVLGADLMNGTPIYDIKPYLPYTDCHPEASGGFAAKPPLPELKTVIGEQLLSRLPQEDAIALAKVLSQDPRPPYQCDPKRIYVMEFRDLEISFSVDGNTLTVTDICKKLY